MPTRLRRAAYAFVAFVIAIASLTLSATSAQAAGLVTVTQSYAASPGYVNSPTTLSLTFTNSTGADQSAMGFLFTLPTGLTFALGNASIDGHGCPNPQSGNYYVNSVSQAQVSNIFVAAGGTCTLSIRVVAPAVGSYVGTFTNLRNIDQPADVAFTVVDPATQPRWDVCPAEGMLFQDTSTTFNTDAGPVRPGPTSLTQINLATSQSKPWPLPSNPAVAVKVDASMNAVGFLSSPTGGYVWGWDATDQTLVRIGGDGSLVSFGNLGLTSAATPSFNSGDVSPSGIMYLSQSSLGNTAFAQIDLTGPTPVVLTSVTTRSINPGTGMADWAYNPSDGALYGVGPKPSGGTSTYYLWKTDVSTGLVTAVAPLPGIGTGNGANWGADYVAPDSNNPGASFLYAGSNTSGNIYQISLAGASSVATLYIPNGPPASANDGARCATAPLNLDFGDAPNSYSTTLASDGPRDGVWSGSGSLQIGATNTADDDGQPSAAANLDTGDDGVAPFSLGVGVQSTVPVAVTNTTSYDAVLAGWIDLNQNGTFDASERVTAVVPAGSGTTTVNLTFPTPPANFSGKTYGRFRLQSEQDGAITNPLPIGVGAAGEVEDSASVPASIEVSKVVASRFLPTDQFTVSVTGTGVGSPNTATTTGTQASVTTGAVDATFGNTYTVSETAASGDLGNYTEGYSCVDTAHGGAAVAAGSGTSTSFTLPQLDSAVLCTFTNTALTPWLDWGDAPDSYGTTAANDGARDPVWTGAGVLAIGAVNNAEPDGQPSTGANLDSGDDGIAPFSVDPGQQTSVAVTVTNTTSSDAIIAGWIDVNENGTFDISERTTTNVIPANSGTTVVYLTFNPAPINFVGPITYGRFRLESQVDGLTSIDSPTGLGAPGEVEDWRSVMPSLGASTVVPTRYSSTDQFAVSFSGPGIAGTPTASTSGTQTTVTTGQVAGFLGESDTISEAMTSGSLLNYDTTYSCVDTAHGNGVVKTGTGVTVTLVIPLADSAVLCTFTNIAKAVPTLTVQKDFSGKFKLTDEVTITASGNELGAGVSATTTGTTAGTQTSGVVGPLTVSRGLTYTIAEVGTAASGADLNNYTPSMVCRNNGSTVILRGTGSTETITIPADAGAVGCVLINIPRITLAVRDSIVSRYSPTDQFTVSITGGTFTQAANSATTSGSTLGLQSNAVAGPYFAASQVSYTYKEIAAVGSLSNYTTTWTCVTDPITLPANTASGTGTTVTRSYGPTTNPQAVCTFTNTAKSSSIEVAKVVASRFSPSDEFTVSVSGTGLGSPTTSTTTGSATSTTTGQVTSTFGGTYSVSESAASGDLADYVSTYSCVDNAHGGAAVTSGTGTSFFVSPPQIDSIVLCTFTNTADTSAFDWGDATDDYGTLLASDGPRDALWTGPGTLQIGATNTAEADGQPAVAADRDLGDDGVAPFIIAAGLATTVHVSVTNTTANDAVLAGWVDLDQDGLFSTPERVTATVPAGSGTSVVDLVFPAAPVGYSGLTYGRFRLQSEQGGTITDPQPTGLGAPGEVEDWRSVPPSIEVAKVIASRVSASDQFTVSLSGTGLGGSYTASTAGIESTISTGPEPVTFGGVYSISETAASGDLANYDATYNCVDTAHGNASVASGSGTSAFLSLPQVDSIVVCTFTNTANANVLDWGDAPDTYGTTLASDGARDALWTGAGSLMIGSTNTPDADGQPSSNANLDNGDDGVAPFSIDPGQRTSVAVTVTNTTSSDASIAGWIDLDQNGTFDIPERSYTNAILAGSGTQVVYLTFPAASPTFSGLAYLRVRLESEVDGPISSLDNPTGLGPAGEVEDWQSVLPSIAASTAVTTRHASSDQFTVSVTGPGVASPFSATTTGTQASASTSQATAYLGEAYDVSETAASGDLADYVSSYDCVDTAHGSVSVASGSGTSVSVTIPQADSAVECTFTNAAVPPSSLTVHASVSGRYNPSDQFTISDSVSSVTTTGSSNGVQAALVGPATVPGASIFAISEVAAGGTDLARYLVSYSCTNNGGSVITSGNGASATVTIPPGEGNAVVCTFANTARPSITVQKNIASRYLPSDQFKISTTGSPLRFATTSGSSLGLQTGSVLSAVSVNAGQAYTAKEVAASGSLADYSSTWTCVDTQAAPTAPTISGTGATTSSFIFASGTAPHYVCTFTNTALPSVEVAKVVASRSTPTDQFTVSLVGTGIVSPATATTSGTQTAATTGKVIATYGGTYSVTESAASGDLANYDASFSCVDNNYGGASVAAGTGASVFISLPHVDSSVLCTFTNTAKAPPPTPSTPEVNLSTTADRSSLLPSGTVVYTVVGSSVGLAAADGSVIDDPIASGLASYSWTCSSTAGAVCPAPAGTGALHETVATFPANSTVSYTVTARITATPGPSIANRATITPPTGDCGAPGHLVPPCVATVTTPVAAQVSVHKTADVAIFAARGHVVFTMLVNNAGVVPADGTEISDPMVAGFTGYSWTCTAIGTVCPNATGAGALDETIATFPVGSSLTYRLVATVSSAPPALISSTATVSLPAGGMCSPADQPGPCTTTITLLGPSLAATGVLIGGWLLAALASLLAGTVALLVSAGARRPSTAGRGRRRTRS